MPQPEQKLWYYLRKRFLDLKFRRQFGIGPYIVDFYCPAIRLAIEVDGDSHFDPDAHRRDERRDSFIKAQGIRMIRIKNTDVRDSIDGVVGLIRDQLFTPSNSPSERGRKAFDL